MEQEIQEIIKLRMTKNDLNKLKKRYQDVLRDKQELSNTEFLKIYPKCDWSEKELKTIIDAIRLKAKMIDIKKSKNEKSTSNEFDMPFVQSATNTL